MNKRLLVAATLICAVLSACNLNQMLPNIQTGSHSFDVNPNSSNMPQLQYSQNFPQRFGSVPQVTLMVNGLKTVQPSFTDWQLKIDSGTNQNRLVVNFNHVPSEWRKLDWSYLATTRPQLTVGVISTNFNNLMNSNGNVTIKLDRPIQNPSSFICRGFFVGIKQSTMAPIFTRISNTVVTSNLATITIQVVGNMNLQRASVSYVIFNPQVLLFATYGGSMNENNLTQPKILDIYRDGTLKIHSLMGINLLRHTRNSALQFQSQITQDCYLRFNAIKPIQTFSLNYIVFGIRQENGCEECNVGNKVRGNLCLANCPPGTVAAGATSGVQVCRRQINSVATNLLISNEATAAIVNKQILAGGRGPSIIRTTQAPQMQIQPINRQQQINQQASNQQPPQQPPQQASRESDSQFIPLTPQQQQTVQKIIQQQTQQTQQFVPLNIQQQAQQFIPQPQVQTQAQPQPSRGLASQQIGRIIDQRNRNFIPPSGTQTLPPTNAPSASSRVSSTVSVSQNGQGFVPTNSAPIIATNTIFNAPIVNPAPLRPVPLPQPQPQPQSYTPPTPAPPQAVNIIQPRPNIQAPQPQGDCSTQANTYWTGYRCACRVGFTFSNNLCIASQTTGVVFRPAEFIYKISLLYRQGSSTNQCAKEYEVHNGVICDCMQGYFRHHDGSCINKRRPHDDDDDGNDHKDCPQNSVFKFGKCICLPGYEDVGKFCVPKKKICDDNSYDNGLGVCLCRQGFISRGGVCVPGNACPPFSLPDERGNCICEPGYRRYGNSKLCSQCPPGQVFVGNQCITTCGVNQIVNNRGVCQCRPNFGRFQGVCSVCPSDFFIKDGYCVTCPINSQLDPQTNQCVCRDGHQLNGGICQDRCPRPNEVFSVQRGQCVCFEGLGRINGVCQICNDGWIDPVTQQCRPGCRENEVRQGSRCVCKAGFGRDQTNRCIDCTTIGGFEVQGCCVLCPFGQVVINRRCSCPPGKDLRNGVCVQICLADQLIDNDGRCYWCPSNQEPRNGRCQCRPGYNRVGQFCQSVCPPNHQLINGVCAICVLGTQLNPVTNTCTCPQGTYTGQNNICVPIIINCPANCATCSSPSTCTVCNQGYQVIGGRCQTICGDGITAGNERCDDGNRASNDGCSFICLQEPGYTCRGRPSLCSRIQNSICGNGVVEGNQRCDDRNNFPSDGCFNCQIEQGWTCNPICRRDSLPPPPPPSQNLFLVDTNFPNNRIVRLVLGTSRPYPNLTADQKMNFIKLEFPDRSTIPVRVFCTQSPNNQARFQCLLNYSVQLPPKPYEVNCSYQYQGDSGSTVVTINPRSAFSGTRNRG